MLFLFVCFFLHLKIHPSSTLTKQEEQKTNLSFSSRMFSLLVVFLLVYLKKTNMLFLLVCFFLHLKLHPSSTLNQQEEKKRQNIFALSCYSSIFFLLDVFPFICSKKKEDVCSSCLFFPSSRTSPQQHTKQARIKITKKKHICSSFFLFKHVFSSCCSSCLLK